MEATDLRSAAKANGVTALDSLGIPALDSFIGVREKREAWRAAASRFSECEEKIKRVREERDTPPPSMQERAEASLRGEAPAARVSAEDLASLYDERQVLATAVNLAKESLDKAIDAASSEVCKRLVPKHRELITEIATRAVALQEAIEAEEKLTKEIRSAGFKVTALIAQYPRLAIRLGKPGEPNGPLGYFLKALRDRGVQVGR